MRLFNFICCLPSEEHRTNITSKDVLADTKPPEPVEMNPTVDKNPMSPKVIIHEPIVIKE